MRLLSFPLLCRFLLQPSHFFFIPGSLIVSTANTEFTGFIFLFLPTTAAIFILLFCNSLLFY